MRFAVTGATGFIGAHVQARLSRENHTCVASGRDRSRSPAASAFVELDLASLPADPYERLGCPEVLIHLAWGGLPNYRSLHHFESELPQQYAFLKQLIEAGLRHLVVVGTCFEYGMRSGALSEEMATAPTNPYGFAKDVLRSQLQYLARAHDARLTWARLFYLWGDGQAAGSLYPLLTAAVQRGDPAFDMSGGEQLRDYLPIETVADYLVRLAARSQGAGIVNICSGRPISIRRLVEGWIADNGWKIRLNLGKYPYPDYEPMAFWGAREKLQRCLDE